MKRHEKAETYMGQRCHLVPFVSRNDLFRGSSSPLSSNTHFASSPMVNTDYRACDNDRYVPSTAGFELSVKNGSRGARFQFRRFRSLKWSLHGSLRTSTSPKVNLDNGIEFPVKFCSRMTLSPLRHRDRSLSRT